MQLAPDETSIEVLADRFHRFESAVEKRFAHLEEAQEKRFAALSAQIERQSYVSREVFELDRAQQDRTAARAHARLDNLEGWRLKIVVGMLSGIILWGMSLALILVRTT